MHRNGVTAGGGASPGADAICSSLQYDAGQLCSQSIDSHTNHACLTSQNILLFLPHASHRWYGHHQAPRGLDCWSRHSVWYTFVQPFHGAIRCDRTVDTRALPYLVVAQNQVAAVLADEAVVLGRRLTAHLQHPPISSLFMNLI